MQHPRIVAFGSGQERTEIPPLALARALGDLRYDALAGYLSELAKKIAADAEADLGRRRPQLADRLQSAALSLRTAEAQFRKAWVICEPHTESDDE